MRAVLFNHHGDYNELQLIDLPQPEPAEGEVLVQLTAAAVNPIDEYVRRGYFPAKQPPLVPGVEGAGRIVASRAAGFDAGNRVMVRVGGIRAYGIGENGTWQEYVTALPEELALIPVPDALTDIEAAGFVSAYLTAQVALEMGGFKPGQSILIPAVGGSVGNAAVQLAQAQGARRVITTAGITTKAEQARSAGYADVIDLSQETLSAGVARLTDGAGIDLVIDSVAGSLANEALIALRHGGTMITLGYTGGTGITLDAASIVTKEARILGLNLFAQPLDVQSEALKTVLRLAGTGKVKPLVSRTFPLAQAAAAQRYLIEERPFGRVVLTIS